MNSATVGGLAGAKKLLYLVTGNFDREGTNNLHTWLLPLWGSSRGQRSEITGYVSSLETGSEFVDVV